MQNDNNKKPGLIRTITNSLVSGIHEWSESKIKGNRITPSLNLTDRTSMGAAHPSNFVSEMDARMVDSNLTTAIARLSEAIIRVPLRLYEIRMNDGKEEKIPAFDHPAALIWERPMPEDSKLTTSDLKVAWVESLIANGNAYNAIEGVQEPQEIWPIPPDHMYVSHDNRGLITKYTYRLGGEETNFAPREVIHIRIFSITNLKYGRSRNASLINEILGSYYAKLLNVNFFKNGAVPPGVLCPKRELDKEDHKKLKAEWNELHRGVENAFKVGLMPLDVDYKSIMQAVTDISFKEYLEFNREVMNGVHGLPPIYAGILKWANFANSRVQKEMMWTIAVLPLLIIIANALNHQLLWTWYDQERRYRYEFDTSGIEELQGDQYERAKKDRLNVGYIYTANEIRKEHGLIDHPDGDVLVTPGGAMMTRINESAMTNDKPTEEELDDKPKPRPKPKPEKSYSFDTFIDFKVLTDEANEIARLKSWHNSHDRLLIMAENGMKTHMQQYFRSQAYRVMKRYRDYTQGMKTPLFFLAKATDYSDDAKLIFNVDVENRLLKDGVSKYYQSIMKKSGDRSIRASHNIAASFNVYDPSVLTELDKLVQQLDYVNANTWQKIKDIIAAGYTDGLNVQTIGAQIRDLFYDMEKSRSELIARTEMNGVVNAGANEAYIQADVEKVQWLAFLDSKTRVDHSHVHLETVNVKAGELFQVGNDLMRYPGDPDASIGNRANCRCTTIAIIED